MQATDADYYENPAHWTADRYLAGFEQRRLRACVDLVPAHVVSLLDIGCGNGAFLHQLEQSAPQRSLIGLDRSTTAITAAQCTAPMTTASAHALPFADRTIDMVCALDVIEHLPHDIYESALREIARVAGRHILINVPYRERRLALRCPYCDCRFNPHYHMRSFDETVLASLFADFEPMRTLKTKRRENLLLLAVRPFRRRVFGGFPATAICPQCAYRARPPQSGKPAQAAGFRHRVRTFAAKLPTIAIAAEIAMLYRRRDSAHA